LQSHGFDVLAVADGQAALRAARDLADVAVLDIGLPAVDGFDVLRVLRRESRQLPIVILTARTDEVDRIIGFELGADDYVVKPFSPREVVARVKAIARRIGLDANPHTAVIMFGRLEIDESAREVRIDGEDLKLKPREFALLFMLASNAGIALSRRTLLERVWGFDYAADERTVDVHVRRIRLKMEDEYRMSRILHTVHGFGYKFTPA
jgi:two-component system response regulator ResD